MNNLEKLCDGCITVFYTKRTQASTMKRLAEMGNRSSVFISSLFGCESNLSSGIYWLPESEWRQKFSKRTYGYPSSDCLPAVDVDFPGPLAGITDLIDFKSLTAEQVSELSRILKLSGNNLLAEIEKQFETSKDLYTDLCIEFILPHEIAHNCWQRVHAQGRPIWVNEFAAQIAGVLTLREFGMGEKAEFYSLFYRLMYSGGRDKVKYTDLRCEDEGRGGDLLNHAWLHGADLQMLWELEQMSDKTIGQKFLRLLGEELRKLKTKDEIIPDATIMLIMNKAAGKNLQNWFAKWGIPSGKKE